MLFSNSHNNGIKFAQYNMNDVMFFIVNDSGEMIHRERLSLIQHASNLVLLFSIHSFCRENVTVLSELLEQHIYCVFVPLA